MASTTLGLARPNRGPPLEAMLVEVSVYAAWDLGRGDFETAVGGTPAHQESEAVLKLATLGSGVLLLQMFFREAAPLFAGMLRLMRRQVPFVGAFVADLTQNPKKDAA